MSSGIRGTRARLALLVSVLALSVALVACEDGADGEGGDAATDTGTPGLGTGIDRQAILGEVDQVRAMFAQSSTLDARILEDVSYEDDRLRVTLGADATGAGTTGAVDAAARAEQVCDDLAEAMQLPDLQISVHSAGGEELAACRLGQ